MPRKDKASDSRGDRGHDHSDPAQSPERLAANHIGPIGTAFTPDRDGRRVVGKVKRLVSDRGFGFVTWQDERGADREYFFHRSAVIGVTFEDLSEGDTVSFLPGRSVKGPRAQDVSIELGGANGASGAYGA